MLWSLECCSPWVCKEVNTIQQLNNNNLCLEATLSSIGFSGGSDCKESTCNSGDPGSVPGLGRSPGVGIGNGYPLQYSCLEFHGERNLASYSPWGCRELDTTE